MKHNLMFDIISTCTLSSCYINPLCHVDINNFVNLFSFLLARHKAALEVYNEAAKLSTKDWVCM